jgi:hypothetical protein
MSERAFSCLRSIFYIDLVNFLLRLPVLHAFCLQSPDDLRNPPQEAVIPLRHKARMHVHCSGRWSTFQIHGRWRYRSISLFNRPSLQLLPNAAALPLRPCGQWRKVSVRLINEFLPRLVVLGKAAAPSFFIGLSEQLVEVGIRQAHLLLPSIEGEGRSPKYVVNGQLRTRPACDAHDAACRHVYGLDPMHTGLGEGWLKSSRLTLHADFLGCGTHVKRLLLAPPVVWEGFVEAFSLVDVLELGSTE